MSSIAVIDIGSTKALAAIAEIDGDGNAKVIAMAQVPCKGLKKGTVVDLDEAAGALLEATRKTEQMANRKISSAVLSVAGDHLQTIPSQGLVPILNPSRTISREDVHRVINHSKQIAIQPERELILAIPRSYRIDGQDGVTRPLGMSGERLEVSTLLVTGVTTHLENLDKCINRAQIEVEQKIPHALASGYGTLSQSEKELGALVVDVGGDTTDIAIFENGSVAWSGMIPVGSAHITSDISVLLKTSVEDAERIKREDGTCLYEAIGEREGVEVKQVEASEKRLFSKRVLGEIIAARAREILCMVKEEAFAQGYLGKLGAGVVLTGGGSNLQGFAELAEKIFDTSARVGRPERLPGLGDKLSGPEHASAVGLIKHAIRMREEEAVAAESGDWRKVFRTLGSIFSPRSREEAN